MYAIDPTLIEHACVCVKDHSVRFIISNGTACTFHSLYVDVVYLVHKKAEKTFFGCLQEMTYRKKRTIIHDFKPERTVHIDVPFDRPLEEREPPSPRIYAISGIYGQNRSWGIRFSSRLPFDDAGQYVKIIRRRSLSGVLSTCQRGMGSLWHKKKDEPVNSFVEPITTASPSSKPVTLNHDIFPS